MRADVIVFPKERTQAFGTAPFIESRPVSSLWRHKDISKFGFMILSETIVSLGGENQVITEGRKRRSFDHLRSAS